MKKSVLLTLVLTVLTLTLSCKKAASSEKNKFPNYYISAEEFIGTSEEFKKYSERFFIPREEFLESDENFKTYVSVVNDPRLQKGFFEKRRTLNSTSLVVSAGREGE